MPQTDHIWQNLSDFWVRLHPTDREFIETLWYGLVQVLDAEYAQLYQIDSGKTVSTCPIFNKYRWLCLDLSEKNRQKVNEYARILRREDSKTNTFSSAINDQFNQTNHSDHKHFVIRPEKFTRNINLPFKLWPALTDGYKLYSGIHYSGNVLYYGSQYSVQDNVIRLDPTVPSSSDVIFSVGINQTNLDPQVAWYKTVIDTGGSAVSEVSSSPRPFIDKEKLMIFVNGYWVDPDEYSTLSANTIRFSLPRSGIIELHWWEEDESLIQPQERHQHLEEEFFFNTEAFGGVGVSGAISEIPINPPILVPSYTTIGGPDHRLRLFIKGKMFPPELYSYNASNGTIVLNNPYTWTPNEFVPVRVEWEEISPSESATFGKHIHVINQESGIRVIRTPSEWDDGGRLDDGGFFDTDESNDQIVLPFSVTEPDNFRIFFNGRLLTRQYDYIIGNDRRTITFRFSIEGGTFRIEYERESRNYVYGAYSDATKGLTDRQIAQANMLLFCNEDPTWIDTFSVNGNTGDSPLDAKGAYQIASQDIILKSIPQLQDRVDYLEEDQPLKLYEATDIALNDFSIVNGGIQSDLELPEKLWCPVVWFDESMLAKNFGIPLEFVKLNSGEDYANELQALWQGLWTGPVVNSIEWVVSMFLGVPFFKNDGQVTQVYSREYRYVISSDKEIYTVESKPNVFVGDKVFPGQSVFRRNKFSTIGSEVNSGEVGSSRLFIPGITDVAKVSDIVTIVDGSSTGSYSIVQMEEDTLILNVPLSGTVGLAQLDTFDSGVTYNNVSRSITWTGFKNYLINSGFKIRIKNYGIFNVINVQNQTIFIDESLGSASLSGLEFSLYNDASIGLVETFPTPQWRLPGEIVSIQPIDQWIIGTNTGEIIELPFGLEPSVKQGDRVQRFQPASYQVAAYDHHIRPNWHLIENSAFEESKDIPSRYIPIDYTSRMIVPEDGNRVLFDVVTQIITLTGVDTFTSAIALSIGDTVFLKSNGERFTVIASGQFDRAHGGSDATEFWVSNRVVGAFSDMNYGDFIMFLNGPNASSERYRIIAVNDVEIYISDELKYSDTPSVARVERLIRGQDFSTDREISVSNDTIGIVSRFTTSTSGTIPLVDVNDFPEAGIIRIDRVVGGISRSEAIFYREIQGNELRDCIRGYESTNENQDPIEIPSGTEVRLIRQFDDRVLREVFFAAARDLSSLNKGNDITANQENIYNLMKNTVTIVELFANSFVRESNIVRISTFLDRIIPASASWFADVNKGINDKDIRFSDESLQVAEHRQIYRFSVTGSDWVALDKKLSAPGVPLSKIRVGDIIHLTGGTFTEEWAYVTEVAGIDLILDREIHISDQSGLEYDVLGIIDAGGVADDGTWESQYEVMSTGPLDLLVIVSGQNTGVYTISEVISNQKFRIQGTFKNPEDGSENNRFYVTSESQEVNL